MQETEGSVVNTAAENAAEEKASAAPKKNKKAKKEPKIPTVSEVVQKETSLEEQSQASVEPADSNETAEQENQSPARETAEQTEVEHPSVEQTVDDQNNSEPDTQSPVENQDSAISESDIKSEQSENNNEPQNAENQEYPEEDEEAFEKSENERIISGFNLEKETALVETVLFLESEPQNSEKLAIITQLSVEVVNEAIGKLKEKYENADSGIELAEITGGWQLVPKKEMFNLVRERYGKKNGGLLSKAALETLSIIAYSQPITRAEIESLRHVSADNMMHILLERKFIKEVGKKDVPGKPTLYGTTKEFLEFFHLQNISELPQLDEVETERFVLAR